MRRMLLRPVVVRVVVAAHWRFMSSGSAGGGGQPAQSASRGLWSEMGLEGCAGGVAPYPVVEPAPAASNKCREHGVASGAPPVDAADDVVDALWELFRSRNATSGDCRARVAAELRQLRAPIPRWCVAGQTWDAAAANVLYVAACWLYGAADVSEKLLQSYVGRVSVGLGFADTAAADVSSNANVLAAFIQRFEFEPARIRLPMLKVDEQLVALKQLYLASGGQEKYASFQERAVEFCLQRYPFSPIECFVGCTWQQASQRVLVAVSWQAQRQDVDFVAVSSFQLAFGNKAVNSEGNNSLAESFEKDFMIGARVNIASVKALSLENVLNDYGSTLGEGTPALLEVDAPPAADGSAAPRVRVELKFIMSVHGMRSLLNRTNVVTPSVYLSPVVVTMLREFLEHPEQQCFVVCGEAGCGKTLFSIAAAAHLGICMYMCLSELEDLRSLEVNDLERDEKCAECLEDWLVKLAPGVSERSAKPLLIVIDEVGGKTAQCNGFTSMSLASVQDKFKVSKVKIILAGTGCEASALSDGTKPERQRVFAVPARTGGDAVVAHIGAEFPLLHRLLQQPRFGWILRVMGNGRVAAGVCKFLRDAMPVGGASTSSSSSALEKRMGTSTAMLSSLVSSVIPSTVAEAVLQSAVVQSLWNFKVVTGLNDVHVNTMLKMFRMAFAVAAGDANQRLTTPIERGLVFEYGILTDTARYVRGGLWSQCIEEAKGRRGVELQALIDAEAREAAAGTGAGARALSVVSSGMPARARVATASPLSKDLYVKIVGDEILPTGYVLVARTDHRFQMSAAYCEMGLSLLGVQARPWTGEGCELLLADFMLVSALAAHSGVKISVPANVSPHSMAAFGAACRAFAQPEAPAVGAAVVTIRDFAMTQADDVARQFQKHVDFFVTAREITVHGGRAQVHVPPPKVAIAVNKAKAQFVDVVLWRSWDQRTMCVQVKRYTPERILSVVEALHELHKMGCVCFASTAARLIDTWVEKKKASRRPDRSDEAATAAALIAELKAAERTEAAKQEALKAATELAAQKVKRKGTLNERTSQTLKASEAAVIPQKKLTKECLLEKVVAKWRELDVPAGRVLPAAAAAVGGPPSFVIAMISGRPEEQVEVLKRAYEYLECEGLRRTAEFYVMEATDADALAPLSLPAAPAEGDVLLDGLTTYYSSRMAP